MQYSAGMYLTKNMLNKIIVRSMKWSVIDPILPSFVVRYSFESLTQERG